MAYACPVCDAVEADAEHLANHLAITATLHEDDHAAWLDDHAPDWPDRSPSELGETAVEHAEKRDVEGTTHSHEHGHEPDLRPETDSGWMDASGADDETERVLREARELTRQAQGAPEGEAQGAPEGEAQEESEGEHRE
jgi:hypothetical protein